MLSLHYGMFISLCISNYCLHAGVAVGSEFCGPESPALRDPNIWIVTVGKLQQDCVQTLKVNVNLRVYMYVMKSNNNIFIFIFCLLKNAEIYAVQYILELQVVNSLECGTSLSLLINGKWKLFTISFIDPKVKMTCRQGYPCGMIMYNCV